MATGTLKLLKSWLGNESNEDFDDDQILIQDMEAEAACANTLI